MTTKIETFLKPFLKKEIPDIRPGDTVRIYQKIKEVLKKTKPSMKQEEKERIQTFEGLVIARKHGKGIGATISVRKVISGIGVERTFPLHSPTIEKIEIIKRGKARRAKLYYLRKAKGRKTRLKRKEFVGVVAEEKPEEESAKEQSQQKQKDESKKNSEN